MKKINPFEQKILVVDDDQDLARMMMAALSLEGYQLDTASSGEKALKKMASWNPHLILLDINMPGLNGLETLQVVRGKKQYVSVIFISAHSTTEDVIRGLDAGADDYICKPFNPNELLARVRSQLRIKDLTDKLETANERLSELVQIDDLTGLYNMRNAYNKLDLELSRGKRFSKSVCVCMLDMDHFKRVNDGNDHLFGSFVLSEIGKIIKSHIRDVDFGVRYGGDEFMVVLGGVTLQGAKVFTERIRERIENYEFDNGEYQIRLTCSIGFALSKPGDMEISSRRLIQWADRALYNSKEQGRNKVSYYDLEEVQEDSPVRVGSNKAA